MVPVFSSFSFTRNFQRLRFSQIRGLNFAEYAAKDLLKKNGCMVQDFFVVSSTDQKDVTTDAFRHQSWKEYVVKAQIFAGGRGRGRFLQPSNSRELEIGGVLITQSRQEAQNAARFMLGNRLITKQTTAEGTFVKKVMVAESVRILRETYLAIVMDRSFGCPVIVASPSGGMEIEDIAAKHPELILREPIDIEMGVTKQQCLRVAEFLNFSGSMRDDAATQIERLYNLFISVDATQIEINPLAETDDRTVYCIDAKFNFDDSAAFRQKEIFKQCDLDKEEESSLEERAKFARLHYIGLNGNIGCIVNGAGLALATMDIIKLNGGEPANFMDVGGGATVDQVTEAFHIVSAESNKVRAVFVNIFGGIMRCDIIAEGLIRAAREKGGYSIPVVARLQGTRVDVAKKLLAESRLNIITCDSLQDAARLVVEQSEISNFVNDEPSPKAAASNGC